MLTLVVHCIRHTCGSWYYKLQFSSAIQFVQYERLRNKIGRATAIVIQWWHLATLARPTHHLFRTVHASCEIFKGCIAHHGRSFTIHALGIHVFDLVTVSHQIGAQHRCDNGVVVGCCPSQFLGPWRKWAGTVLMQVSGESQRVTWGGSA